MDKVEKERLCQLTLEAGTDRMSQNFGAHISHDLAMQALVWLSMLRFRVIQLGASYANLR